MSSKQRSGKRLLHLSETGSSPPGGGKANRESCKGSQDDVLVEDDGPPLIPDGSYLVQYVHHETAIVFGTAKVFVYFKILEPSQYFGVRLFRAFRAADLVGKSGRNGRFRLKKRSDLYLTLCWLYEEQNLRPDRVSLRYLKDVILQAKIRTVKKDYKQRALPKALYYSVIDEIQGIEVGTFNI